MQKLPMLFLFALILGCADSEKTSLTGPTPVPPSPPAPAVPAPSPGGFVSINFDDGRTSAYQNAIPVMDRDNLKSTNYIITGRFNAPGYIGQSEVLSLQSRGHEVGAHTRSHQNLTSMNSQQIRDEIDGSRKDLFNIGIRNVQTFAYPFGNYNGVVIEAVRSAGFSGARSTNGGFNNRTTDKFILLRQNLGSNTTLDQVRSWIDTAIQTNTWLVLVAHNVEQGTGDFTITPQFFEQIINAINEKRIRVITMSEGIRAVS